MALNGYEKLADLTAQDARIDHLRDCLETIRYALENTTVARIAQMPSEIADLLMQDQAWEENRQFDIRREADDDGAPADADGVTRTSFFTFALGTPLAGRYVRITATEPEWPHERMYILFGSRWSSEYPLDWGRPVVTQAPGSELELTDRVLSVLRGGDDYLPDTDDADVLAVRAHMAQDLSAL